MESLPFFGSFKNMSINMAQLNTIISNFRYVTCKYFKDKCEH